jgi:hypothetical protein
MVWRHSHKGKAHMGKQKDVVANTSPLDTALTNVVYGAFVADANAEDAIKLAASDLLAANITPTMFRLVPEGKETPAEFSLALFSYINNLAIKARFGEDGIALYNKAQALRTKEDSAKRAAIVKWMNKRRERLADTMQAALDEQADAGSGNKRERMMLSEWIDEYLKDGMEKAVSYAKSKRDINTADVAVVLREARKQIKDL